MDWIKNEETSHSQHGPRLLPTEVSHYYINVVHQSNTRSRQVNPIRGIKAPPAFLHQKEDHITLQYQTTQQPEAAIHHLLHFYLVPHAREAIVKRQPNSDLHECNAEHEFRRRCCRAEVSCQTGYGDNIQHGKSGQDGSIIVSALSIDWKSNLKVFISFFPCRIFICILPSSIHERNKLKAKIRRIKTEIRHVTVIHHQPMRHTSRALTISLIRQVQFVNSVIPPPSPPPMSQYPKLEFDLMDIVREIFHRHVIALKKLGVVHARPSHAPGLGVHHHDLGWVHGFEFYRIHNRHGRYIDRFFDCGVLVIPFVAVGALSSFHRPGTTATGRMILGFGG
mmetsp:Transcript_7392/g.16759  ORF Transcript_7392/g.16759 Transcript_7392/m.16759 type:complete len:337 (+) Transcript_7392:103-1113(+)